MKKKIGILTQPLSTNYGGLIQAFALQKFLMKRGYEVQVINRVFKPVSIFRFVLSLFKTYLSYFLMGSKIELRKISDWKSKKELKLIAKNTEKFIKDNIIVTEIFKKKINKKLIRKYNFDGYVVGSDQVWRPMYSPYLPNYFFDFLNENDEVKRVSYAASFGVDFWEFNNKQTNTCKHLVKQFEAVSVREDSGVDLCKQYFGIDAVHLLDPTMLLDNEDYEDLVKNCSIAKNMPPFLTTYFLDEDIDKIEIAENVAASLKFQLMSNIYSKTEISESTPKPPVEEWLERFMKASFVVTDSFHGTVFSIIFNIPFIVIANKKRGISRFTSLLSKFNLEDRLVFNDNKQITENIFNHIDWKKVNEIRELEKLKSIDFIEKSFDFK
jgi:hypothetical protein